MHEVKLQFTKAMMTVIIIVAALSFYFGYSAANLYPLAKLQQANGQQGTSIGNQAAAAATATTSPQPSTIAQFALPSYETPEGSSSGKINMIEFGDYQCPYCGDFFKNTEPQVQQNYVSNGKVKFYFLDFAFLGPDSTTLAEGAWCANDQGLFWQYHDYIYSHQQQENSGWATADKLKAMVGNITGLDVQKFSSCLGSNTYASRVQQNTALGQQDGIQGTPGFLIGNDNIGYTLLGGDYPYASFQQALDAALQKA